MNVLHVVVAGEIGGAERMLVDLVRASSSTHAIALMTPSDRLRALFRDSGLDVVDRGPVREDPVSFLARSLGRRDVRWLADLARERGARVVHTHTFASQVVGTRAAIAAGARVVRTEHSTRVFDDPSCWPFSRWSLRRADASVCISEHVRRVALAKAPWAEAKMRVVPNGVDVARFGSVALPSPSERVRFLISGRLEPRKGVDVALHALALVPGAELEIAGDGDDRDALQRLAAKLGVGARARFTGFFTDVRDAIARADVALSSARAEGLGIALLEAMAARRPVVALPTGGVPELVRDGETGWLARGATAEALARAMKDAMTSAEERARRGERARELAAERFSIDAMARGYEAVYASIT
ncbi:MAG TPA: glycosyltransferase family 4 protein [Labilithrix sp.]